MNAKKLKKLRRIARRAYGDTAQLVQATVKAPNRGEGKVAVIAVNHPKTARGMVRMMKRGIAREEKRMKQP